MHHFALSQVENTEEAGLEAHGDNWSLLTGCDRRWWVCLCSIELVDLLHSLCEPHLDRTVTPDRHEATCDLVVRQADDVVFVGANENAERALL